MSWSPEKRAAVLVDLIAGLTQSAASEKHGVPLRTVKRWAEEEVKVKLSTGETKTIKSGSKSAKKDKPKSAKKDKPKNGTKDKAPKAKKEPKPKAEKPAEEPKLETQIYEIVPGGKSAKNAVEAKTFEEYYKEFFATLMGGFVTMASVLQDRSFVKDNPSGAVMIAQFLSMRADKVVDSVRDEEEE